MTNKKKKKAGSNRKNQKLPHAMANQMISRQFKASPLTSTRLGGVADVAKVTLRYAQVVTLTTSTLITTNVFRGNSGFDPDVTGTGQQPVWWDDYSLFYSRYRVISSRCTAQFVYNTNSGVGAWIGITPRHLATLPAAGLAGCAATPENVTGAMNGNTPGRTLTNVCNTADFLGYKSGMMGSDDLAALVTANPAHQWYWHVYAQCADGSTSLVIEALVTIDYDLHFFDRVDGAIDLQARCRDLERKLEAKTDSVSTGAVDRGDEKPTRLAVDDEYVRVPGIEPIRQAQTRPVDVTPRRAPMAASNFASTALQALSNPLSASGARKPAGVG